MAADSNDKNQNNNKKPALFQLTKQQVADGVAKYDKAAAAIQAFQSLPDKNAKLKTSSHIFQKRLNSLDSTILEENAYKAIDDVELQLEKKIENCENEIKNIDEKIAVAEAINDEATKQLLLEQKQILTQNLEHMKYQYTEQNIDTKLTTVISETLNFPRKINSAILKWFTSFVRHSKLLRKISPLKKIIAARETLEKLNKINKSVDCLVNLKSPFGEQDEKYQTLINHLAQANALHTQIRKELNK